MAFLFTSGLVGSSFWFLLALWWISGPVASVEFFRRSLLAGVVASGFWNTSCSTCAFLAFTSSVVAFSGGSWFALFVTGVLGEFAGIWVLSWVALAALTGREITAGVWFATGGVAESSVDAVWVTLIFAWFAFLGCSVALSHDLCLRAWDHAFSLSWVLTVFGLMACL